MTAYSDIKNSRRVIWAGVLLGFLVAVIGAVINLRTSNDSWLAALAFLALLSLPSLMALVSLDRRPSLLPAATMAALLQGVVTITSPVAWLMFAVAILWAVAARQRPTNSSPPRQVSWLRPLLAAATVLPLLIMFMHLDPMCTTTNAEGQVVEITPDESAPRGWIISPQLTRTGIGSNGTGAASTCASDTIQAWEASLSVLLSAGVAGLASRWPTNEIFRI